MYYMNKKNGREARLQKKDETIFLQKKAENNNVFNTGYLTRQGDWIQSNSPIEKSTF